MMEAHFNMLAIPLATQGDEKMGGWFVLSASSGASLDLDADICKDMGGPLPAGWKGRLCGEGEQASICLREQAGQTVIRLLETQSYEWGLEDVDGNLQVKSSLDDKRKQRWMVRKTKGVVTGGQFMVINHLGFASLVIQGADEDDEPLLSLPFEFVSKKLDFDSEYRKMTEDIADFCEQLLLTWEAPTALRFSSDPTERSLLLLERFLFLRNFLTPDRLGRLLEVIERNPHSYLRSEREWRPSGMVRTSDYLSHPGTMLRSWHRNGGRNIPAEVLNVRKEDTHDTPPNQFVKFALGQFRHLCSEVIELRSRSTTVGTEAWELIRELDAIMGKRFFRDIRRLNRLPLDNQTLQKGEGYREVLKAWLLTEASASLDWKGLEDSYEGATRDVATLYEYWIFLKLHEILGDIEGMERLTGEVPSSGNVDPFVSENSGEILIHLKSGKHSRACFLLKFPDQADVRVDLHYERTFSMDGSATSGGSYSRQFRPDYTLSIFPANYDTEAEAVKHGKLAHLHFDAKYRAVKLGEIFGDDDRVEEEKQIAKVTSTYQRGDLLKMHTYNDALRQTIGSYVLYPGDEEDGTALRKFHEIAPGVGAFVMKPGNHDCLDAIRGFIVDSLKHQSSQFTQFRYLADTRYQMHRKKGQVKEDDASYYVARTDAPCVLVWLKKQTAQIFKEHGFVYCHALPLNDKKLDLNLSVETGSEFIPCGGSPRRGEPITGLGWRGKITSARFMAKQKLLEYITTKGLDEKLSPSSVDHYLVFEFEDIGELPELDLDGVHKKYSKLAGSRYMAVSCKWTEILKSNESKLG